ncbi:MAG: 3-deoxy-8-phosphooctulonate synthase [Candidatus Omnitrophota bacterium]|nr:3-deoxy-8-phosphooctulonate synthase [Candidatus Omnitrophota bacterium]
MKTITLDKIKIGNNNPLVLIAGPCVIETKQSCFDTARHLKDITQKMGIPFIFKSSFDKANRTSLKSYRGPGLINGLKILKQIKQELNIPVLSDVHTQEEVKAAAKILDILQIPAFLCRQTDLILAVADTGKIVNIKKGQFLAPGDVEQIIRKIESRGNKKILITERGTSFGYNNLVSDFRSLIIMPKFGFPIIYDATHSVQLPGGKGYASSGEVEFVPALSRAAVACGVDGLFLEVHLNPKKALCDGPNMLSLSQLIELLPVVKDIDGIVKLPL